MNLDTNKLSELLKSKIESLKIVDSVITWKDDDIAAAATEMRGKAQSNIFIFPSAIDVENTIEAGVYVKGVVKRNYSICITAVDPKRRKNGSTQLNDMLDKLVEALHLWSPDGQSILLIDRATQVGLDQTDNPGRHSWIIEITIQSIQ